MTLRAALVFLILTIVLAGCATTDRYQDRVISYNEQTDSAYDSMLLLNIVRSSYRMPTQFMDVSSIVGSNGATASATFNGSPSPTGSAAADLSYSSTFTAPVLNTKEFYQGILTSISPDTLHYYFQTSRPLELVFNLMFDRVTIRTREGECARQATLGRCVAILTNDPRNPQEFALFETVMKYLLVNGFSTEKVAVKKPRESLSTGKVSISVSSTDVTADPRPGASDTKAVRFCFHPGPGDSGAIVREKLFCDYFSKKSVSKEDIPEIENAIDVRFSNRLADTMMNIANLRRRMNDQSDVAQTSDLETVIDELRNKNVQIALRIRSTSAAVEYLGRVIESQRDGKFNPVLIRNSESENGAYTPCLLTPTDPECTPLFVVDSYGFHEAAFAVSYRGAPYAIPADRRMGGNSTYTLGILKQLVSLNNSSKSSPTPAILTGIPAL